MTRASSAEQSSTKSSPESMSASGEPRPAPAVDRQAYAFLLAEYARLAPRYDRRWRTYTERCVERTLAHLGLGPGASVLDVACGTGALLESLAQRAPAVRLAGIDLSPEMVAIARGRLGGQAILVRGYAECLPFADECFDAVVSTSALHFVRQPLAALHEMRRVLRPGGSLVVTDWCRDFATSRLREQLLRRLCATPLRTYSAAECAALMERAGFADVRVARYKINWLWGAMTARAVRSGKA